jgi:hypothetical protein
LRRHSLTGDHRLLQTVIAGQGQVTPYATPGIGRQESIADGSGMLWEIFQDAVGRYAGRGKGPAISPAIGKPPEAKDGR